MEKSTFWRQLGRDLRAPLHRRAAIRRLDGFHAGRRDVPAMVRLALEFGGRGHYRLRTMQVESEIQALVRAVAGLEPKVVLEFGTAAYGTLLLWSQLASELVISCDLRERPHLASLRSHLAPPGSACRVELLVGDSHSVEFQQRVRDTLGGRSVDFLFIDGDHTEKGVEADFRAFAPLVRHGGLIAFHDIAEQQPLATNQVQHFWPRVRGLGDHEEFVADRTQCGYGIGLLRVGEGFDPSDLPAR